MICPKCRCEQGEGNLECRGCGVIFARLTPEDYAAALDEEAIRTEKNPSVPALVVSDFLLEEETKTDALSLGGRFILFVILFIWGWRFILSPIEGDYIGRSFLHGVNLAFHEAGHVIFWGKFMTVLGGSLMQILMPMAFVAAFLYYRNPFAAAVALWWAAQNFMDIAPYINDARSLQLPLLGGITGSDDPDFHDWHYLLREMGWLKYDHIVARISFHTGTALMIVSFVWGGLVLWRQFQSLRSGEFPSPDKEGPPTKDRFRPL